MYKMKIKMGLAAIIITLASTLDLFAQADALVDMLQKKGLLTQREANEVKDQMLAEIRDQMPATKINIGSWLDELRIYGDMRARFEGFYGRSSPSNLGLFDEVDRTRYRLRLRIGAFAKAGDWSTGLRLASGDTGGPAADAISTNTSFDQFFGKKPINIDMAFLTWEPSKVPNLKFTAGKMENPFWETDMVFDGDLTLEGLAEQYSYRFLDEYSVFGNIGQFILAEDNTTQNLGIVSRGEDAYMFGFQVGHKWKVIPSKIELTQALAYYDYSHLETQAATAANTFTGAVIRNSLTTAGTWQKDYNILAVNNEIKLGYCEKVPMTLMGEYINNVAAQEFDDGYKVGIRFWEAKKKGQYEVAYWYERLDADANVSIFADSDFGSGGTNTQGHILKAKYNFTDWASLGFAYWYVENADDFVQAAGIGGISAGNNQMRIDNRIQLDLIMKF
jgi:hypothetical protein